MPRAAVSNSRNASRREPVSRPAVGGARHWRVGRAAVNYINNRGAGIARCARDRRAGRVGLIYIEPRSREPGDIRREALRLGSDNFSGEYRPLLRGRPAPASLIRLLREARSTLLRRLLLYSYFRN